MRLVLCATAEESCLTRAVAANLERLSPMWEGQKRIFILQMDEIAVEQRARYYKETDEVCPAYRLNMKRFVFFAAEIDQAVPSMLLTLNPLLSRSKCIYQILGLCVQYTDPSLTKFSIDNLERISQSLGRDASERASISDTKPA